VSSSVLQFIKYPPHLRRLTSVKSVVNVIR
jgi:hypothetical protein